MDNGSQSTLTLIRLPEGGYVVEDGFGDRGSMRMQHFASASIDEALSFMRAKIAPIPRQVAPENYDKRPGAITLSSPVY